MLSERFEGGLGPLTDWPRLRELDALRGRPLDARSVEE